MLIVIDLYLIYLKAMVRNGGIDAVWAVDTLISSVSCCLFSKQLGVSIASGIHIYNVDIYNETFLNNLNCNLS